MARGLRDGLPGGMGTVAVADVGDSAAPLAEEDKAGHEQARMSREEHERRMADAIRRMGKTL